MLQSEQPSRHIEITVVSSAECKVGYFIQRFEDMTMTLGRVHELSSIDFSKADSTSTKVCPGCRKWSTLLSEVRLFLKGP